MAKDFKRKVLIVDKDFQIRFVRKFASITVLGSVIAVGIILAFYYFTYKHGGRDLYRYLIEVGADEKVEVNIKDNNGKTPLHLVSSIKLAKLLVKKGGDVNKKDKMSNSPLHAAAKYKRFDLIRLFLRNGALLNRLNKNKQSPMNIFEQEYQASPLHWWVGIGDFEETMQTLKTVKNINIQDKNGQTPLHIAANYGRFGIARLLIARGASLNIKDKKGQNPEELFKKAFGSSSLHWWTGLGKIEKMKEALSSGIPVQVRDSKRVTPLHIAAELRNPLAAKILLQAGAKVYVRDINGNSPLSIAQKNNHIEMLKLFYVNY